MAQDTFFEEGVERPPEYARLVYEGVYRELAVPLKGGRYRDVGLALLEAAEREVVADAKDKDAREGTVRSLKRLLTSTKMQVGDEPAEAAAVGHKSE